MKNLNNLRFHQEVMAARLQNVSAVLNRLKRKFTEKRNNNRNKSIRLEINLSNLVITLTVTKREEAAGTFNTTNKRRMIRPQKITVKKAKGIIRVRHLIGKGTSNGRGLAGAMKGTTTSTATHVSPPKVAKVNITTKRIRLLMSKSLLIAKFKCQMNTQEQLKVEILNIANRLTNSDHRPHKCTGGPRVASVTKMFLSNMVRNHLTMMLTKHIK